MYYLTLIKRNGGAYIDSREVAEAIGKRHHNLLRDIKEYIKVMRKGAIKIDCSDFFLESSYQSAQNKEMFCFLLSKMGCELVASKLTGEKGVLFSVAYVMAYNRMEAAERAELEARAQKPAPRLGEYNACARLIVPALRNLGATSERIIVFLKGIYEPLGIAVAPDDGLTDAPQTYTAKQIAKLCGLYSHGGNPHAQAVSCIINENLLLGEKHKTVITSDYGNHIGVSVRYDEYAARAVMDWLAENGYPDEIYGFERTYYALYDFGVQGREAV
jgi:Rha family phage regulatory protein